MFCREWSKNDCDWKRKELSWKSKRRRSWNAKRLVFVPKWKRKSKEKLTRPDWKVSQLALLLEFGLIDFPSSCSKQTGQKYSGNRGRSACDAGTDGRCCKRCSEIQKMQFVLSLTFFLPACCRNSVSQHSGTRSRRFAGVDRCVGCSFWWSRQTCCRCQTCFSPSCQNGDGSKTSLWSPKWATFL